MSKTLRVTASGNDVARIRKWVAQTPEKTGSVVVKGSVIIFTDNGETSGKLSFHTHPLTEAQGGYQPPSVTDLETLLNGALRGIVERHYVLCAKGMYIVSLKCNMSRQSYTRLKRQVLHMKQALRPSQKFHSKWMNAINEVCPRCCTVKFTPWR